MHLLNALLSEGSIIDLDGTFFIQFAIFWVAFFVLRSLVFKPLVAVFEEREEAIDGARRDAKQFAREASEKEAHFDKELHKVRTAAGEERDALRTEAKHLEGSILEKVRAETEKSLKEADEQLSHEAKRARQEIQATTPALAKQIATKLLQREVR